MKKVTQIVLMACLLFTLGFVQAKGKPGSGGDADPQVFKASVAGLLTSMQGVPPNIALGDLYTRPDGNYADPKNVSFTGNGSNEVRFTLDKQALSNGLPGYDIDTCFPDAVYSGSIHLINSGGKKNADQVARAWISAKDMKGGMFCTPLDSWIVRVKIVGPAISPRPLETIRFTAQLIAGISRSHPGVVRTLLYPTVMYLTQMP